MSVSSLQRVQVVDSHTGGEPTRVVIAGGPELRGSVAERARQFREQQDRFRAAVVNEPRGSDVMVGALLMEPSDPSCAAAVIFFNNVGLLGMCGHGTIGVIATLARLGRIGVGQHRIETPVGTVNAELFESGEVAIHNVNSFRIEKNLSVAVEGIGTVKGDVAWGGNWFFLVDDHGQTLELAEVESLVDYTWGVRQGLERAGIRAGGRDVIDHIELFSPGNRPGIDSRNFVLCPGKAYDRSPCGTGLSAKLACLYADGKLQLGEVWTQESITGSVFKGMMQREGLNVFPTIIGSAWVNAEATLILDPRDPCCWGIGTAS